MRITPFLLDRWLSEHQFATPPIEFDLAASTGPWWTWDELMSQLAPGVLEGLGDAGVSYGPAVGSPALRQAIAEMTGVCPAEVVAVTGASEALWLLLLVAAEPGANVVLPHPGYPAFDELARHLALEVRHYHLAAAAQHNIDVDELAARLDDRTAVVIVNTPHNPTGSSGRRRAVGAAAPCGGQPRRRPARRRRGVSPDLPRTADTIGGDAHRGDDHR